MYTLFVLAIGPMNYWLLRRRKRLFLLVVTIPAGDWQGPDSESVEYWLEVSGQAGQGASGSAAQPHRCRLY